MRKPFNIIIWSIALLSAGFLAGLYSKAPSKQTPPVFSTEIREGNNGNSMLTNPLLECETGQQTISKGAIRPFPAKMEDAIQREKQQGHIEFASFYFRDLNNGAWFGVNEQEQFKPASLLKVPLMLYYLKQADQDPSILEEKVIYQQNGPESHQFFTPLSQLEPENEYTVEEAIESMITNSDNRASVVLSERASPQRLDDLLILLGIGPVSKDPAEVFISVRQYASFFRILFNASYVSQTRSEQALRLLRDINFKGGLRAGIPANITVAHKFREATNLDTRDVQFHDCGIVYYPNKPFLVCIMTRGRDMEKVAEAVTRISRQVFEEVDSQIKNGSP